MPPRHLWSLCICLILATRLAVAHTDLTTEIPEQQQTSWFDNFWKRSILRFFAPASLPFPDMSVEPPQSIALEQFPVRVSPNCAVDPLPLISDPEALEFEVSVGTPSVVDLDGLTNSTALALADFQRIVGAVGGTLEITSGYRPVAYQEHLQAVWDKWMLELRRNRSADCSALRAQVEEEFESHQLLVRQRPAPFSDHTLGISFDAHVSLPRGARYQRRRVSLDMLAKKAGFNRPAVRRDPVHFRLINGRDIFGS